MTIVVDTNLLILLVVGMTSRSLVRRHRRLSDYDDDDFKLLKKFLESGNALALSPFALTELSNLAVQGVHGRLRSEIRETIKALIDANIETQIASALAASRPEYHWLGLTDAALLQQCERGAATLLTSDRPLYVAAAAAGQSVILFDELRVER